LSSLTDSFDLRWVLAGRIEHRQRLLLERRTPNHLRRDGGEIGYTVCQPPGYRIV